MLVEIIILFWNYHESCIKCSCFLCSFLLSLDNWTLKYESVWVIKFPRDITDDGSSLSEACSTPIIGAGSRAGSSHTVLDMDDIDPGHLATRSSLSSLGVSCNSLKIPYSLIVHGEWTSDCNRSNPILLISNFREKLYLLSQFNAERITVLHLARINGTRRSRSENVLKFLTIL